MWTEDKLTSSVNLLSKIKFLYLRLLLLFSCSLKSNSLQPHGLQEARLLCTSLSSGVHSDSMSIELVMSSNHLILSRPLLLLPSTFLASGSFPMSQLFVSDGQNIGASASASVLPMNIQSWFSLRLTGWISLLSRGLRSLLQHHSPKSSIFWHSPFFMVQLSHPHMTTTKIIALTIWNFIGKVMPMLFNMLFRFVMAFLSRSIF